MRLFVYLGVLLCMGCGNRAASQEQEAAPVPQPVAVPPTDSISNSRQNAITRAVRTVTPAIVSINVIELQRVVYRSPMSGFWDDPFFSQFFADREGIREVEGLGSGFVISPDGYIVTNDHVAGDAKRITVSLSDGRTLEAELVGTDAISDLALIKVNPPAPLPYLEFAQDEAPIVGEWAIALGNPLGLFEATEPSVTVGVVSAVGRDLGQKQEHFYYGMIQTDAAINVGNSGGPLVNALGQVIGVNTAIVSEGGGSDGLGFAVPSSKVQRIIAQLQANGAVDRAYYSGLSFIDFASVTDHPQANARGVVVAKVDAGSPAAEAGFRVNDVVIAVEGENVSDFNDYRARIYDFLPGDVLSYRVVRDESPMQLTLRIDRRSS